MGNKKRGLRLSLMLCAILLATTLFSSPALALTSDVPPENCIGVDTGVNWDAVGYTGNGTFIYVNRLEGFTGKTISKIWFYFGAAAYFPQGVSSLTLKTYQVNPDTSLPGTELVSQSVDMSSITQSGWYGVELDTPLAAPADQLFVGVEVAGETGIVVGVDDDTDLGTFSYVYADFSGWGTLAGYSFFGNYMLRAEVQTEFYEVDIAPSDHGQVTANKDSAQEGETVELTVTPDSGYRLAEDSLMVNGVAIEGTSFVMPGEDVTITAAFEQIPYSILVSAGSKGTISTDKGTATAGETVNLTITPAEGYQLVPGSLKVNGVAIEGTSFIMPSEEVTITAEFALIDQEEDTDNTDQDTSPDTGDSNGMGWLMALAMMGLCGALGLGQSNAKVRSVNK